MEELRLTELSDERVLEQVEVLVARSNRLTAELLAYLAEVDTRGLHLRQATGSLFAFCVERLHMSESAAGKRITAARTARRFPRILEMIARGEIHLCGVNLLAPYLTEENHVELLGRARHLSKRAIEKLVAELAPRPDVPSRVVALPRRAMAPTAVSASRPGNAGDAQDVHVPGRATSEPASPRPLVAPLSPRRYQIRVTVGEETHAALGQLQDLLSHQVPDRDPAVIIARALDLLLERTLARKAGVTKRPREGKAPEKRTRHIPAGVRRAVWKRDAGQCAFVDGLGRRCASTPFLQFHHRANWARGAEHEPDQMELRCRAHNQYQAVLDYGAGFMAAKRSRAEEPRPAYLGSTMASASRPRAGRRGRGSRSVRLGGGDGGAEEGVALGFVAAAAEPGRDGVAGLVEELDAGHGARDVVPLVLVAVAEGVLDGVELAGVGAVDQGAEEAGLEGARAADGLGAVHGAGDAQVEEAGGDGAAGLALAGDGVERLVAGAAEQEAVVAAQVELVEGEEGELVVDHEEGRVIGSDRVHEGWERTLGAGLERGWRIAIVAGTWWTPDNLAELQGRGASAARASS